MENASLVSAVLLILNSRNELLRITILSLKFLSKILRFKYPLSGKKKTVEHYAAYN